ncbi:MAG TPA: imidazole glycerol phosphate synthase subunit HisH [Geminicoccaceae bacterium]|nr:imidazole glycerol phosphate synthase subunit HisH [Geminicoccaceae bacterium]
MSAPEVVIVPTGTANLASVRAALLRLGAKPRLADDAALIEDASHVVLPGVGSFGAAVAGLREAGFDQALIERVNAGRATLAMCVGLQVLFEASEENPDAAGLGVLPGRVGRFPESVRVPQFGWNRITPEPDCRLIEPGYAYFANSYRVLEAPGCAIATAEHGGRFVAALERGGVLACQFHPELSGAYGHRLIARWLEA